MQMTPRTSPFHSGELAAQREAGVGDVAAAAASFIRGAMPDQHRRFFSALPFLVVAGGDRDGRPWVSVLEGPDGFATSPDPRHLTIATTLGKDDPLAESLAKGGPVGLLGIELATRRRNRLNGALTATPHGYALDVSQSFGNCPQYIHERDWHRDDRCSPEPARTSDRLDSGQTARIAAADTFFIGSGRMEDGYDASHRGGAPGFVRVAEDGSLQIPDYPGNNFFNTIGNLIRDPRVGLLFVDFETGGLLHITGRARIDWHPTDSHDANARRMIHVRIDKVVDRPSALSLRWSRKTDAGLTLVVVDKVHESDGITSFYLSSANGAPLGPYQAGQHLPVSLDIPGQPARVERSYSLSGNPEAPVWRISVKREDRGVASRFLHDVVRVGDRLNARRPQGEFTIPTGDGPLVLVSAGVGITPMLSMLHAVVADQPERPVWFVQSARDHRHHAFAAEVNDLVASASRVTRQTYYSAPEVADDRRAFDRTGRIGADDLLELRAGNDADYMLCGPVRFLGDIRTGLEAGGVPAERIHVETFGPVA